MKKLLLNSCFKFFIFLMLGQCVSAQKITQEKGLITAIFTLPAGTKTLYLPNDNIPKNIISGRIKNGPAGNNEKAISKNLITLQNLQVSINGEIPVLLSEAVPTFKTASAPTYQIQLMGGRNVLQTIAVVPSSTARTRSKCTIPSHALTGTPIRITGPFDGNAENTKCSLNNREVEILAESVSQCIALYPADAKGIQTLTVEENNQQKCEEKVSGVEMNVSAGKLNLQKRETTFIDVSITGLQNLPGTAILTLKNITSNVVLMQPANSIVIPLLPDSVASGLFNRRFNIQSLRTGTFTVNVDLDLPEQHFTVTGPGKPPVYADNKGADVGGIKLHPLAVDGLKNGMSDAFKKTVIEVTGNRATTYPELDGCGECLTCIQSMLDEVKVALVGKIGEILLTHYVDLLIGKTGGALAWVKDKFDKAETAKDIAKAIAAAVAKNEMQVVEFEERLCGYCLVSAIGFYDTKTGCMDAFFYCKASKMCCTHSLTIIHVQYCANEKGFIKKGTGLTIDIISR